jgi:hypothetical protein
MQLPPCHALFQFYVVDGKLSCQLYQRSADIFLGVSFNIASYALLTHMMAQQAGLEVGDFVWTGGDCHLYSNHLEQVELELSRAERPLGETVIHHKPESLLNRQFNDIERSNYQLLGHFDALQVGRRAGSADAREQRLGRQRDPPLALRGGDSSVNREQDGDIFEYIYCSIDILFGQVAICT